jgi:hypothetical protein
MMGFAILAAIPALWIVMMPSDPTFRPDLTYNYGWLVIGLCAIAVYSAQRLARLARGRYDRAIYTIMTHTRRVSGADGVPLELDLGETYPPVLMSRQHRIIAFAAPTPLILQMDQISHIEAVDGPADATLSNLGEPHLTLSIREHNIPRIFLIPGRGLGRASFADVKSLEARIKDFLDPATMWNVEPERRINVDAFVASMRSR